MHPMTRHTFILVLRWCHSSGEVLLFGCRPMCPSPLANLRASKTVNLNLIVCHASSRGDAKRIMGCLMRCVDDVNIINLDLDV